MANSFTVTGLAPTHDPAWAGAPVARRATYMRACKALVLTVWDAQVAAGLDKDGVPLAPLRPKTIKYRRSAMGPADPHAPPLIPAHELSRTRSLVDAQVVGTSVRVWWKFDPVSGRRWGTILNYHRKGKGRLPVRDVFGLAPESYQAVLKQAHLWWRGFSAGLPVVMPLRPRPGKAARPAAAKQPAYKPKTPGPRPARPAETADVSLGADIYTMSKGSAAELLEAIRGGRFTGFRSYEGAGPSPPTAPRRAPAPKPAKPAEGPLPEFRGVGRIGTGSPEPLPLPAAAPSRATLGYADEGWQEVAARAVGRPVATQEVLDLSGAATGKASIAVRGETELSILARAEHYIVERTLKQGQDRRPVLEAVDFEVAEKHRGQGIGTDVFRRMVEAARRLGISRIETHAARGLGKNGYYTWARFGYDAEIPPELKRKLPEGLADAGRISDLMATPEGTDWWKTHGKSIYMSFDLTDDSGSMRAWEAYVRGKTAGGASP